jgi:hypothetical protein
VTVTPRKPPNLQSDIEAPKTTRNFETDDDVPSGAPINLRVDMRRDTELGYKWDPPACEKQNGRITQYEYEISGLEEWNEGKREGITSRPTTLVDGLMAGSRYRMRVRAYTKQGAGAWSDPLDIRTTGSELGAPRELTAVQTKSKSIQLTWLPPYPERSAVSAYRIRYSPRSDDSSPVEKTLTKSELSCSGFKSPIITNDNVCSTIDQLAPTTTYRFAVQAQSESGNWGDWSSDYFSTTRECKSFFNVDNL